MSSCRVNRQSGECLCEVSRIRTRCDLSHIQPKSEPRARQTFYRVVPHACMVGASGTGTSPLPRPMQMVALEAAICIGVEVEMQLV